MSLRDRFNFLRKSRARAQGECAVDRNIQIHDRIARAYEGIHGEIFNGLEQHRLSRTLDRALSEIQTGTTPPHVLDFGCGSGNLTAHLLHHGARVTAADVAPAFLQLVRARYENPSLSLLLLEGGSLGAVSNDTFDMIATYSVLHHVPDYLAACAELARVCRPGGIIYIDHEASERFWHDEPMFRMFQKEGLRFDWRKYASPSNYVHRIRRVFNKRYSNEGDIHVWPDDHIEWDKIKAVMYQNRCTVVNEEDYLLYRKIYRREIYEKYQSICADTKLMIFRKHIG